MATTYRCFNQVLISNKQSFMYTGSPGYYKYLIKVIVK